MNTKFYPQALPPQTARLLSKIETVKPSFLANFYLSGGTALSLQLGHRESEDLDFFSQSPFDPRLVQTELEKMGHLSDLELSENTLNGYLDGVKLQFLGYPYPLLEPLVDYGRIKLSSLLDIACTKLQTVGMRGNKKDFVDMYILLQKYPLLDLLNKMREKYQNSEYNLPHIFKSLVYFADAENQAMPRLHTTIKWRTVKTRMIEEVKIAFAKSG